jgi:hypothetical protein
MGVSSDTETLIEPVVLAHAKNFVTRGTGEESHSIVDSQFDRDQWGQQNIPSDISTQLAPINSLSMAAGRPDALIISPHQHVFETSIENEPIAPLLAVIEAKGYSGDSVNVEEAITQAHSHLDEVNLAFAAVPKHAVKQIHERLAGELNVGLLGIESEGSIELLQQPRPIGASFTPETETIRFHARIGGDLPSKLKKNQPKNPLGYALAVASADDTKTVCERYVIGSVGDARRDAEALGLVTTQSGKPELTSTGMDAVRALSYCYDGTHGALQTVDQLYRSRSRLIEEEPPMGIVARNAVLQYPPTRILIETLTRLSQDGIDSPQVNLVATRLAENHPEVAVDLFLNGDPEEYLKFRSSEKNEPAVFDAETNYHTHTLFQYKAVLFHTGILTTKGLDSTEKLDFSREFPEQTWELEDTMLVQSTTSRY